MLEFMDLGMDYDEKKQYRELLERFTGLETETVLSEMLKYNTGRSMLDSGGYPTFDSEGNYTGSSQGYGRSYERNQKRVFADEPEVITDASEDGLEVIIETFHFLLRNCEFSPVLQSLFTLHSEKMDEGKDRYSYGELRETFPGFLYDLTGEDITGLYGEGEPFSQYTYNFDNLLSQDILYTYFSFDGEPFALIQSHNGCDARGGFSPVYCFSLYDDGCHFLMVSDCSMVSDDGEHNWYTDDGYHWYEDGSTAGRTLELWDIKVYNYIDYLDMIEEMSPEEIGDHLTSRTYGFTRNRESKVFLRVKGETIGNVSFYF